MAIPMPIVQDIRRLDRQGMSRAQIARRLHVDRGTVAKYADMEDCSPKPKADRRYGSKIDPYAHLVDEWLEADRLLPRKQRHTIRRVHDRLLAETDYDGEYSTTGRYGSITDARGFLTDGTADRSSFARYLRTVGSAGMCFPRDRRDGFPVPPQTTDRLYLGHADHNPFRSFLAEIQAPSS